MVMQDAAAASARGQIRRTLNAGPAKEHNPVSSFQLPWPEKRLRAEAQANLAAHNGQEERGLEPGGPGGLPGRTPWTAPEESHGRIPLMPEACSA